MKSRIKMSDADYFKWCHALPPAAYERECNKRYRVVEYGVQEIDEHGDVIDTSYYDTLKEAKEQFERTTFDDGIARIEIEKMVSYYRGVDRQLDDREFEETGISKERP